MALERFAVGSESFLYPYAEPMPRRKTSRVNLPSPERRLHLRVSSPRIVCFSCLRHLRRSCKLLLAGALLAGVGWGVQEGLREFFIENNEFRLRYVDLETNGEMTAEHFGELTGLDPDSSIFGFDLRKLKEQLLDRPGIERVELGRRLPGTLRVKVEERKPIAWLECRPLGIVGRNPVAGILLDKSGVCFPCDAWWEEKAGLLPVLLVSQVEEGDITIGKEIRHHQARRGLELIRLAQEKLGEAEWSLPVVAVRNDYSLEAITSTGVLATFGMHDHKEQLENLITLLRVTAKDGESMAMVNLIPRRNIPVVTSGSGAPVPQSRLQRDIQSLLRQ
jgi:hypothetical protein